MSVLNRLRRLHDDAEKLASDLPTEEMFLRFSDEVVSAINNYIEEVEEAAPIQVEQPEPEPIEEVTPKTTTEDGALCPVCREGHLMKGACDKCGFDEAEGIECPGGLVRPFEKVEVCRGCLFYKRVYGNRPAFCKWDQWVDKGDEG